MHHKILYLPVAEQDIDEIGAYLSQFYANTFKNFLYKLQKTIGNLQISPHLGAAYRGYHSLIIDDYIVFYKVDEELKTVKIYRVLHGARDLDVCEFDEN